MDCFDPLNRGMGVVTRKRNRSQPVQRPKFRSPQSGNGGCDSKKALEQQEYDTKSFDPLNRGMGVVTIMMSTTASLPT